jgi:hypothetical protein
MKAAGLRGMKWTVAGMKTANHPMSTTQPCHVTGGPHPQPYRFARNQYLGLSLSTGMAIF